MSVFTWLNTVGESEVCVRLTLALLHFLWLGTLIAVAVAIALRCLSHRSARLRYGLNLAALVAMAVCLPVAWMLVEVPRGSLPEAVQLAEGGPAGIEAASSPNAADSSIVTAGETANPSDAFRTGRSSPVVRKENRPGGPDTVLADAPAVASSNSATIATQPAANPLDTGWSIAHWAPLAAGLYVAGVVVMLLRLLVSIHGGRRLRTAAEPLTDARILRQSQSLAKRLGLRFTPAIAFCSRVSVPVAAGILRPMILLPGSLATGLTPDQFEAILLHEMAHIRRHDLIFNLLQRFVESLLFFHPGVWYVSRRVSVERENCCDDVVVSSGWKQTDYAAALISMAEACLLGESSNRRLPISTVAASGAGRERSSEFKRRIERLLGAGEPPRLNISGPMLALVAMLSVAGVLVSAAPPAPPVDADQSRAETGLEEVGSKKTSEEKKEDKADPDAELLKLVDEAIAISKRRGLSAEVHTPWQIMQGLLAFGSEHQLLVDGDLIPLTKHLESAPQFRGEFWFERTKNGGRAHPYSKPFLFEGHPNQFAAWLAVAGISPDAKIGVADGHISFGDLVRHAQSQARVEDHEPWTLMLLAFAASQGGEWQDAEGTKQRLEEFVEVAIQSLPDESSPALKSATLFALAKARSRRPADLSESVLWKIDRAITEATILALREQNDEGAVPFATRKKANGAPPKLRDRISDTGSTLAWISRGAARSLATGDQTKKAARFLAKTLIDQSDKPLSTSALFQAVHGLSEFRTRMNRYRVFEPKLKSDDPDVVSAQFLLKYYWIDPKTGQPLAKEDKLPATNEKTSEDALPDPAVFLIKPGKMDHVAKLIPTPEELKAKPATIPVQALQFFLAALKDGNRDQFDAVILDDRRARDCGSSMFEFAEAISNFRDAVITHHGEKGWNLLLRDNGPDLAKPFGTMGDVQKIQQSANAAEVTLKNEKKTFLIKQGDRWFVDVVRSFEHDGKALQLKPAELAAMLRELSAAVQLVQSRLGRGETPADIEQQFRTATLVVLQKALLHSEKRKAPSATEPNSTPAEETTTDDDALRGLQLAVTGHALNTGIDRLKSFFVHARRRHGDVPSMKQVESASIEHLKRALDAEVPEGDQLSVGHTFAWDQQRVLNSLRQGTTKRQYWLRTRDEAWFRGETEGRPTSFLKYASLDESWRHVRLGLSALQISRHRFWWGESDPMEFGFSAIPAEAAAYSLLGTERFGGEDCHLVESKERHERLWISRRTGRIRGYLRYHVEGVVPGFFKTLEAQDVAGRKFSTKREYIDWFRENRGTLTVAQHTQLNRAWAARNFEGLAKPHTLIRFSDYREIASAVWFPFREDHASWRLNKKSGRYEYSRSVCVVDRATTQTGSLEATFRSLTPKAEDKVLQFTSGDQGSGEDKPAEPKPARNESVPNEEAPSDSKTKDGETPGGRSAGASNQKPPKSAEKSRHSRVVDAQGRPVVGANVEIVSYRRGSNETYGTVITGKNGEFVYPKETPPTKLFRVNVYADGFKADSWIGNRVAYRQVNGARQPDTLDLHRPATISGTVIGKNGRPLANADVAVDHFQDGGSACINCIRLKTDQNGKFKTEDVWPGNIFVRYETGETKEIGIQPGMLVVSHFKAADGETVDDVVLDVRKARCELIGRITDENGKGVKGRWISATVAAARGRLDESIRCTTDDEGRFRFTGLAPDEYVVGTYTPGFSATVKTSLKETARVELYTYQRGKTSPPRKTKLVWGKPDKNGIATALRLEPGESKYKLGEKVTVHVMAKNIGEKTQLFRHTFSQFTDLQVLPEDGGDTQHINYAHFTGLPFERVFRIDPGHEVSLGVFRIELLGKDNTETGGSTFAVRTAAGKTIRLQANLSHDLFSGGARPVITAQSFRATGITKLQVAEE